MFFSNLFAPIKYARNYLVKMINMQNLDWKHHNCALTT